MRERRAKEASVDAACDAHECGGVICTAEDPRTCRVHGIASLEREDLADKHKGEIDLSDAHCLRDIANSMTMKDAEEEIAKNFSFVISSREEFVSKQNALTQAQKVTMAVLASNTENIDAQTLAKSKKCLAATLKYIKSKYKNIALPTGMAVLFLRKRKEGVLSQTYCLPIKGNYLIGISYAWFDKGSDVFFTHGDYRDNFDCLRHELFHAIEAETEILPTEFYDELIKTLGKEKADAELRKVSRYAYVKRRTGESEAEVFSKMTSPDYDGTVEKSVESIVKRDAKGEHNEKDED